MVSEGPHHEVQRGPAAMDNSRSRNSPPTREKGQRSYGEAEPCVACVLGGHMKPHTKQFRHYDRLVASSRHLCFVRQQNTRQYTHHSMWTSVCAPRQHDPEAPQDHFARGGEGWVVF